MQSDMRENPETASEFQDLQGFKILLDPESGCVKATTAFEDWPCYSEVLDIVNVFLGNGQLSIDETPMFEIGGEVFLVTMNQYGDGQNLLIDIVRIPDDARIYLTQSHTTLLQRVLNHNLRTDLTTMRSMLELLALRIEGQEEAQVSLQRIIAAAEQYTGLVNDLIATISCMDGGRHTFIPVGPSTIAEAIESQTGMQNGHIVRDYKGALDLDIDLVRLVIRQLEGITERSEMSLADARIELSKESGLVLSISFSDDEVTAPLASKLRSLSALAVDDTSADADFHEFLLWTLNHSLTGFSIVVEGNMIKCWFQNQHQPL